MLCKIIISDYQTSEASTPPADSIKPDGKQEDNW